MSNSLKFKYHFESFTVILFRATDAKMTRRAWKTRDVSIVWGLLEWKLFHTRRTYIVTVLIFGIHVTSPLAEIVEIKKQYRQYPEILCQEQQSATEIYYRFAVKPHHSFIAINLAWTSKYSADALDWHQIVTVRKWLSYYFYSSGMDNLCCGHDKYNIHWNPIWRV